VLKRDRRFTLVEKGFFTPSRDEKKFDWKNSRAAADGGKDKSHE